MDYPAYLTHAFEQFTQAHDQWMLTHRVNDWENWNYDSDAGLLIFSTNAKKIYFRYVPVGTYSSKTNTWLWSWNNLHSVHPQKKLTHAVRAFGERHGYPRLSEGHFTDEESGWDYTAIAYDRLGGIGGYRVRNEHLLSYMLVIEQLDNDKVEHLLENPNKKTIECNRHGMSRHAFVCGHLGHDTKVGFYEAFETHIGMLLEGLDDDFQGWCGDCERVRVKAGGWNDESQACLDMKLVCEDCYFSFKVANSRT